MSIYTTSLCNSSRAGRNGTDTAPRNFDPATYPIIACHFFGVAPLRSIGSIAAEVVADLRVRRQVQRLHRLGSRVTAELLAEIAAERTRPAPMP